MKNHMRTIVATMRLLVATINVFLPKKLVAIIPITTATTFHVRRRAEPRLGLTI